MHKPTDGFEILVNGIARTFRDTEADAFDAARELAARKGSDVVQIRYGATGKLVTVTPA